VRSDFVELRQIARNEADMNTFLGQFQCNGRANATIGTGNQRDLAIETEIHPDLPPHHCSTTMPGLAKRSNVPRDSRVGKQQCLGRVNGPGTLSQPNEQEKTACQRMYWPSRRKSSAPM